MSRAAASPRTRRWRPPSEGSHWPNSEWRSGSRRPGFWACTEHFYPTNNLERAGFGTHYVVLAYELTSPVQDALLPKEQHGEYAWLTEAELLNRPKVHENTKAYFRRL